MNAANIREQIKRKAFLVVIPEVGWESEVDRGSEVGSTLVDILFYKLISK